MSNDTRKSDKKEIKFVAQIRGPGYIVKMKRKIFYVNLNLYIKISYCLDTQRIFVKSENGKNYFLDI